MHALCCYVFIRDFIRINSPADLLEPFITAGSRDGRV